MKSCTSVHNVILMGGFHIALQTSEALAVEDVNQFVSTDFFYEAVSIQGFKRTSQQKTHTTCTQTHQNANSTLLPNTQIRNGGREKRCEFLRSTARTGVPGNPRASSQFGQMGRSCCNQKTEISMLTNTNTTGFSNTSFNTVSASSQAKTLES